MSVRVLQQYPTALKISSAFLSLTPFSPPIKCASSTTKRLTFWTFFLCFQRRDRMSHLSGVLMMMSPLPRSFRSVLVSPVSSTTFLLKTSWNFWCQSMYT